MLYTTLLRRVFCTVFGPLPDPPADGSAAGLVLVADGVGGLDLAGTGLQHMAARAGLGYAVKVVPWGHGFGRWHRDLTNVQNHTKQAAAMAEEVRAFREGHPGRPVFLVGKSGGTGLIVRTLELLPEGAVEAAVLMAPAISPRYDLRRALSAVRRELVVFWSPLDVFILGVGTALFGTIDRVRGVSAGMVGFRVPSGLDEEGKRLYARLRQVRWSPGMLRTFNFGGHVGPDNPAFLRKYVVPLLHPGEPTEAERSTVAVATASPAPAIAEPAGGEPGR
jgi:pimeloyl-ACP methyl ester carboxylesterase